MRDGSRSHGFMKAAPAKLTSSLRSIHPQSRASSAKSVDGGDDSNLRAMCDEEFLGHDLPPNYIISREDKSADERQSRRKSSVSSRDDCYTKLSPGEQEMWDEEFLGHELPSNYRISREKGSGDLTQRKAMYSGGRRGQKKSSNSGEKTTNKGGIAQRHARFMSEDTLDFHFDRTADSYVLKPAISEETGASDDNARSCGNGSLHPEDESCTKEGRFEERALRFSADDWNLVDKKWNQSSDTKSSRRPSRRGIFHSPSGSDTSLVSTLESSSFSCGSDGSSLAKADDTSQSNGHLSVRIPALVESCGPDDSAIEEKATDDRQFLELSSFSRSRSDTPDSKPSDSGIEPEKGTFLEFNFFDGRMVESRDDDEVETDDATGQSGRNFSFGSKDDDASSDELVERSVATPTVYQSATTQSPESESFFGSSHGSDWSGSQSVSTVQGRSGVRDSADLDDDASVYTEDRTEDWSSDTQYFDANSSASKISTSSSRSSKEHIQLYPEDRMGTSVSKKDRDILRSLGKAAEPDKRNLKASHGTSRKPRSLGSVLSQHLAFTAIPSLRHKGQDKKHYPWADGDSPAKVSAACIEWLWAEKAQMKPVQSLRAIAAKERELAQAREISLKVAESAGIVQASGPPVRNLDSAFGEGKAASAVLRKVQSNIEKSVGADIPSSRPGRSGASPVRVAWRDPSKESRASILASWAAVYGLTEGQKAKAHSKDSKISLLSTSKKVRSGTPVKRSSGSGGCASPRPYVKTRSRLSRHVPKNLALELEVLCRPFGPVLKGVGCLPASKRGEVGGGRPTFFTQSSFHPKENVAAEIPSTTSSSTQVVTSSVQCGRLQCVVTRDGLPSYSLIMDESEEIFVAKSQKVEGPWTEGITHLYTFHSYKGKGKHKLTHWKQWGKKEKPCSDFAGNMKVTSTISPMMSCSGKQTFVESEFVLMDAKVKEIAVSVPSATNSYPRSSFSSWDATPMRSPRLPSSSFSSPSSTYYSLPSPAAAAFATSEGAAGAMPPLTLPSSRYVSQSMPSAAVSSRPSSSSLDKSSSSLDKGSLRLRQLERHVTLASPLQFNAKVGSSDSWSDTETLDDSESRITRFLPHTQCELAAIVVRAPLTKGQDKPGSPSDKWGWGINFLKKGSSSDRQKAGNGGPSSATASREDKSSEEDSGVPSTETCSSDISSHDQVCGSCGRFPVNEGCKGGMSVTLILPAGSHGCTANGVDGPQPLVERWKSGGRCDCGSWDLGCGLTVLDNQKSETADSPTRAAEDAEARDNTLRLHIQGKKNESLGLILTALREGCYTLGFQAPMSPLHAFATAVAVLHSRDPLNASKASGDAKTRDTCRAAEKLASCATTAVTAATTTNTLRSIVTRPSDETYCVKPLVNYQLVCPDPPLSPFGRA
ncbi:hypothetical protein R1sor_012600 [Riccia sorocarpa]|uniref:Uncharacterized protein n=1 Tax=Riccia sorocarpa TaxID=122646 RepID=A0ABD3IAF7_9MARC